MRTFAYAALWGAAMGILLPAANAQEAPLTAAGDVTASEATPLPPLDVTAPSQPLNKPKTSKAKKSTTTSASSAPSEADEGTEGDGKTGIFTLGQLSMIGGATVSNETMWTFNTVTLPQAAALAPGVSMAQYGGTRNEGDVMVRGFDRWRVPLTIDGARIYLPADNRIDMNRFLTPDIAEIQIEKGYVSVLNGPGGMAGSINMVSRKPTKELESEVRVGMTFDGDLSTKNAFTSYGRVGTRRDEGYAQISGTIYNVDQWNLSGDYSPVAGALEKGDGRDGSETRDWRVNAKIGYTPNATDEYAISYTSQAGEKGAPLFIDQTSTSSGRFWQWPKWDMTSLAGFTHTKLGEASYVKTNAYYNTLNNSLFSYDNASYTTQSLGKSFKSWYDDVVYGGSVEVGTDLIPMNTLKASAHYRFDHHGEHDYNRPDSSSGYVEPMQYREEYNWYFAAENTFHATKWFDIVAGISQDNSRLKRAEYYDSTSGVVKGYPTGENDAWNWQSAAILRYSEDGKVYANVSERSRFPTLFERYSTRFGTALPNPDLKAERARNYELGWGDTFNKRLKVSAAVFYTEISDYIDSVYQYTDSSTGNDVRQSQNVGDGVNRGIEFSVDYDLFPGLRVGGNYTYLHRKISDPVDPNLKPTDTPTHEAFLYMSWKAMRDLTITPSLELASNRWSVVSGTSGLTADYAKVGSYALVNLDVEYRLDENWTASLAGKNLTDEYYELTDGYPDPGRQFYANIRAQF
ncbi:iron complex outermembrane recepter protein [Hyphomicrobium sp. 1Nfss2.1]|uniref:TonB-dependent receptor plug domain-containing protein n=1 Tax=Hyphomicrobium sp. 1Nfss2.1 TaxID=3413936 RepID=UPI003C7D0ECA